MEKDKLTRGDIVEVRWWDTKQKADWSSLKEAIEAKPAEVKEYWHVSCSR